MSKSDEAIRNFAEKWGKIPNTLEKRGYVDEKKYCEQQLTALISEGYVSKEEHDKVVQQWDELREALINVMAIIKDCYPLLFDNEKPAVKRAEAAIKNTEK